MKEHKPDANDIALRAFALQLGQAMAERDSYKLDAERYRMLRQYYVDSYIACGSKEVLDCEVDSAMSRAT